MLGLGAVSHRRADGRSDRRVTVLTLVALLSSAMGGLALPAAPAAAVTGYDSTYAGESAFLTLSRGDVASLTVFFANSGTTTWVKAGPSQVDLAACRDDKTTCDAQDASEAAFASGWISATRYATASQSSVAPGQIGTFTYEVKVPATAAAGTYRFNGALVLAASGADIRNQGYYHDVTVTGAPAATLGELDPDEGSIDGGYEVVITGAGFRCSPAPTVTFGGDEPEVVSCGPTSITVATPALDGEVGGTVAVTVTNAGDAPSNALEFELRGDLDLALCAPDRNTFTLDIDNDFFPLPVGERWVLVGEDEGETVGLRITVLDETKDVFEPPQRVTTRVVEELEWLDANGDGRVGSREDLVEVSRNYYAQTQDGTVCYFGEDVDIYEDGKVVSHAGAWMADDPGNAPGIFMPAEPVPGMTFQQEDAPGIAEDEATIVGRGSYEVPGGTFDDVIRMSDFNPLDGTSGFKVWARDVGIVHDEPLDLVSY